MIQYYIKIITEIPTKRKNVKWKEDCAISRNFGGFFVQIAEKEKTAVKTPAIRHRLHAAKMTCQGILQPFLGQMNSVDQDFVGT